MLVLKGADGESLSLFIPIYKVDEEKRLVYGKMTEEKPDSSDEIWDYEGSKPYFEAWSGNAAKTSGGKSLGNLRSMHQPIAAGKLTQFVTNDSDKSVDIAAKVVDDAEWTKVLEGVYTGFSQGGKYVKRWKDPDDSTKTRFISDPVEVSLVDVPCLPSATFEVIRAGGVTEIRKFKTEIAVEPTNEQVATRAIEMAKDAGRPGEWATFVTEARADLIEKAAKKPKADPEGNGDQSDENSGGEGQEDGDGNKAKPAEDKKPEGDGDDETGKAKGAKKPGATEGEDNQPDDDTSADREKPEQNGAEKPDPDQPAAADEADDGQSKKPKDKKAARDLLVQVWQTPDKTYFVKAADAVDYLMGTTSLTPVEQALAAAKAGGKDSKKPYGDVEYADPKNGKYPVDTEEHIRAAWSYINQEKNQKDYSASELKSVKDKIIAAWKDKIDKDGPPSADKMALFGDVEKTIALLQSVEAVKVEKGIYTISSTANVLQSMAYIAQSVAREAAAEGDASEQPSQARDILAALSTFLVAMAEEETTELLAAIDSFDPETSAYISSYGYGEWARSAVDVLKAEMATPEGVAKRGARNSSKDAATIQKMHDHSCDLGAKCQMANVAEDEKKSVEPEDLAKRAESDPAIKALLDERETYKTELAKAISGIGELGDVIKDLQGKMEKLSAEPAPLPPNAVIVDKGGTGGGSVNPSDPNSVISEMMKTADGQRLLAETAIRLSQQKGHRA